MFLITACAHKRTCAQAEELRETALSALLRLAVNPDCSCRKQVEQDGIGSNSSHKNTGVILRPWSLWCDYCPALLVLCRWKQRGSAYQLLTCKTPSTLHYSETFWLWSYYLLNRNRELWEHLLGCSLPGTTGLVLLSQYSNQEGGIFMSILSYI